MNLITRFVCISDDPPFANSLVGHFERWRRREELNFILVLINTASNPFPSLHQAEFFFNIAKQISKGTPPPSPSSDISESLKFGTKIVTILQMSVKL